MRWRNKIVSCANNIYIFVGQTRDLEEIKEVKKEKTVFLATAIP